MKQLKRTMFVFGLCVGLLGIGSAGAYDQPTINLGLTSFLDGGPPAGPGFYFTTYLQYYGTSQFNDGTGTALPLPNPDLDVVASVNQMIYQSNKPILAGGKWGLNVIVPLVALDLGYGTTGPFPEANNSGLGDILVGPFVQWDPVMGAKGPIFMHRVELSVIFPTGRYDANREVNPGSNFISFNPYWAATLFLGPKTTASWRIHYLWNGKNNEPNRGFGTAENTQAGQAFHANVTLAQEVLPKRLRVGLNSYCFKQITDTRADNASVPNRREQTLGIGPGAIYHLSQESHLFLNTYLETATRNRTVGKRFLIRFVRHM